MINLADWQGLGTTILIEVALAILVIPCAILATYYAKRIKPVHLILAFMMMEIPFIVLGVLSQIPGTKIAPAMAGKVVDAATRGQFLEASRAEAMKGWYVPVFMIFFLGTMLGVSMLRAKKGSASTQG